MLMMGNETMGLNKAFKEYCDLLCTIPMSEKSYASSFNVSCAASILMYEITRQRGIKEILSVYFCNGIFQFIGGMKVGEPSADGRGSAPPELAEQQARAGSEAAPATPPL